ncbi:hypothetical protein LOZ57_000576 [Ophidiomyces ophidiicola]|uniref:uncharacterized protein n=1 Tax=Ophidiomyces ophidiicola TaxID=1387563 RepID=UPI0020C52C73|nr:uncharacterized protein LOZ57_000576 [Ophidiomyces ophidiicola]KAI1954226.1 hypothetical protein LOZ57_000576 [Ophidiomyces ophidiicola]KAI2044493.1 hypothetical protein LOZ43_006351 [Ophidiomyces ophidiicola]KAI2083528.1 hypothetical protein LOZ36_005540 [Ophidiomyces ophidiicola]
MRVRFIQAFATVPRELFRLNNGPAVRLRARPGPTRPQGVFDLLTHNGMVLPKALSPETYQPPNEASLRPNTPRQRELVDDAWGDAACVYAIPAGTRLPDDLILVHEFRTHYSLQAKRKMTVEELNDTITRFLQSDARCLTKQQWLREYPQPTEDEV